MLELGINDNEGSVDVFMVEQLSAAVWTALEQTSIKGVTTPAEILSALFTVLYKFMTVSRAHEDPADTLHNTKEINRVLSDFLVEFGSTRH